MSVVRTRFICACLVMLLSLVGNASDWFICFHEDGWAHSELTQGKDHCCHSDPEYSEENQSLECEQCIDVQFKTVEFLANREETLENPTKLRDLTPPPVSLSANSSSPFLKNLTSPPFRKTITPRLVLASTHWISQCPKVVMRA